MPYRKRIMASINEDSAKLLQIWKQERGYRIGKAVFSIGFGLALVALAADLAWSPIAVWVSDIILLLGMAVSLYWLNASRRPDYYWMPAFIGFWICTLPSLWFTGGLYSPFLGVDLALLYAFGAIMETKGRSYIYFCFALIHIPALYLLDVFKPAVSISTPAELTAIIMSVTFAAVFLFIHSMLKTENEIAFEFAEHYKSLASTEEELTKSEQLLREAQAVGGIGSWEWDVAQDRVVWSDELFKIFEVSKDTFDSSYSGYLKRLNPQLKEKIQGIIETSAKTGEDFVFENKVHTSQGERVILSRGRVVQSTEGQTLKMLGTCQDITDRKQIESDLVNARNELEERVKERTQQLAQSLEREKEAKVLAENASMAKMQFLANMSHEIRTPMNSILGFADLLYSEEYSPEERREYLSRIRANGTRLLHLIDDILDLSKFEAGQIPIQKASFSLKALVDDIVSSFSPTIKSKGLKLIVSFPEVLPDSIYSDSHRLSQIFNNLIGNAVKFTAKGEVQILIQVSEGEGESAKKSLIVDFKDSGIGIPLKNQSQLFKPFSQGDNSISRKFGGTGLGLVLSRRIAESLGGSLELKDSRESYGSHFQLILPLEVSVEKPALQCDSLKEAQQNSLNNFSDKKILLAEDSQDNAVLVIHYLKSLGVQLDQAENGLQAVQMALKQSYDCILMDIQMPGMDGLEATRRIRAHGYKKPIIALTAHALPSEIERSILAGCDLHLTKPIRKPELIEALNRYLGAGMSTSAESQ